MNRSFSKRRYYNYANMPEVSEDVLENDCDCIDNTMYVDENECACGFDEVESSLPTSPELAQSYVPYQILRKTFTPEVGLQMGTIFPELVSPYIPCQSVAEINYIKEKNEIKGGCNNE